METHYTFLENIFVLLNATILEPTDIPGRQYDEQPTSRERPQDQFTDHH